MADPFEAMDQRLLSRFGKEAFLQSVPTRAVINYNVEVIGEYGQVVARRTTADLPSAAAPKVGQQLAVGLKTWQVDAIAEDDGSVAVVVLR